MTAITEPSLETRLSDGTRVADLVDAGTGHISRRIYADPELFELEMEHIFRRAWQFIGHESEVPEPGVYVARTLANESVIMIRDEEDEVRVFLNSCRHRGMRVCRADRDNVRFLRCPYHGWTYATDGTLMQAFAEECYAEDELDKSELGLIPVTKTVNYHGLIFGTWDSDAPEFADYLGDMSFYLDMLIARTEGGTKVVGAPQVWDVNTNWKFATDNFTGDNFHVFTAHGSVVELGMLPSDPMAFAAGHLIDAGHGHQLHLVPGPPGVEETAYFVLPPHLRAHVTNALNDVQLSLLSRTMLSVGTVFPNLSYLQVPVQATLDGPPTPFLNFRMWVPTGPTSTRIFSWLFVEQEADDDYARATYEGYVRTFGPSGIFEQDDMENWEECTRVNVGKVAQRYGLHHQMGINKKPLDGFEGPGKAYEGSYGEKTQLAFYDHWRRCLTSPRPWAQQ